MIHKYRLLFVLLFFFMIRIAYSYYLGWEEIPSGSDAVSYNGYALAILNQNDWLTSPDFTGHYRPPLYPLFLAGVYKIFGSENLFSVYFIQALISTITIFYVFKLSAAMFEERKAFLTLLWSGFNIFYLMYNGMILRETLIFFLIIYSFYSLWRFFENQEEMYFLKSHNLWKFIAAFILLLHTDPRYFFHIPFLFILFAMYRPFKLAVKQYVQVMLIMVLLLIPWSVRNYFAYDAFVLVNTRTLDSREGRISMRSEMLSTKEINEPSSTAHFNANVLYPSEEEREMIKKGENPNNRSQQEIDLIMKDVYPDSSFIRRKLYYFVNMWVPFRFWAGYEPFPSAKYRPPWSLRHNVLSILFYGFLIPFFFYAVVYLIHKRNKAVWFLIFPIAVQALLHFLMWGRERYRNHIEAFIIIIGCYGMILFYEYFGKKTNKKSKSNK